MKKLQISGKEFIRFDGLRYNLTDLFRLTTLNGIRLEPWGWAQSENRTRDISRRGWFFKKSWAKAPVLIEYAKYLTPGMYSDVIRALDMDDEAKLISMFGESKAARLDYRVANLLNERNEARARRIRRENEEALDMMRKVQPVVKADRTVEPFPDLKDIPRFNADDLPKPTPRNLQRARQTPTLRTTRSMSHSRSMGSSVTHHRSEPDYLTQALLLQAVMDDTPSRSHHDSCSTPSYSYDSGSSWSGDSGSCDSGCD